MTTPPSQDKNVPGRDETNWAPNISTLKVTRAPTGALNLNVEGRHVIGPLQGFGQLWQKTYSVRLHGSSAQPVEVIKKWKENFSKYWPKENRFYASLGGIAPGEVAIINTTLIGAVPLSTGMLVLYVDDESFALMTPEGHTFAGWVTFSAYEEEGCTVVQVTAQLRATDPIYELGFRLGAAKIEDKHWTHTLEALAADFGVNAVTVHMIKECIDPRLQWSQIGKIWYNAGIRTTFYKVTLPMRLLWKRIKSGVYAKW
jgi:hypothetical protein